MPWYHVRMIVLENSRDRTVWPNTFCDIALPLFGPCSSFVFFIFLLLGFIPNHIICLMTTMKDVWVKMTLWQFSIERRFGKNIRILIIGTVCVLKIDTLQSGQDGLDILCLHREALFQENKYEINTEKSI